MVPRLFVALFAACVLLPVSAQASAPQLERRTLAVSVLDKDGKAVHGLTADNFRGEFRGQHVRILSASEDSSPRRIALLIDTSAGMDNDRTKWHFVWAVAQDAISRLTPTHEVSLFTFYDELVEHSGRTRDHQALLRALATAQARGAKKSTAMYDAIVEVARRFGTPAPGDAILVVSDGIDNASWQRREQIESQVQRAGVRIFAVWIRSSDDSRRDVRVGRRDTRHLAQASGGFIWSRAATSPKT